jgi:hypothetical protein
MRRRITLIAVLGALSLAGAACGSSSSSSSSAAASPSTSTTNAIKLAKTKFVLHAGLAFGAFHRWIYKPAKAGELTHPLSHKLAVLDAALAATFVHHELGLALKDAQADPTLSKLVSPITALQNRLHGQVKSGQASAGAADGLNGSVSSIKQQAAGAGQQIPEQVPATPSG